MIDMDYLRQWIGREETQAEILTPSLAERFNATFDLPGDLRNGDTAPAMIHLCLAQPAVPTSELGRDGHPARGGFLPPVPLPRRMWAGGKIDFHQGIRVGENVTRRSVIRDVTLKQGSSGQLCFVTVEHTITSDGRNALTEAQNIVYRDIGPNKGEDTPATRPGVPAGEHRVTVTPSAALLFRYSALTFNGHRIHYDAPYIRDVEGYPGLIVHGPIQATMLVQLAEKIVGSPPKVFGFRSLSPLYDDADFTLNATGTADGLDLWTSYKNGPVAMQAKAGW